MRVGFDIGGTFTDIIVLSDDGTLATDKILSLLERVGEDVAASVLPVSRSRPIDGFVHGTTVASNAVIEGTAARTGLITTRGFRDELEMRGQRRPNIYDLNWDRLPPLIPRSLRLEVGERILGNSVIERPLDVAEMRGAIRRLVAAGVEAIAICFVNSYLNSLHEREAGAIVTELAPHTVICLSSEVHPEIREYDRTSTTVINASLIPVVSQYLDRLERDLAPLSNRLLVMQSNGGIMSSAAARRRPAYMIESGPAAGVLAAARLASECSLDRVLSLDMGGTTVKACLIEQGRPLEKPGAEVGAGVNAGTRLFGGGGHVVRVPSIDIVEAGAGGGSIAWIDEGGALRVGPRSAGAEPGPICYGRGGEEPTVTDANVLLGYMNPNAIAGSKLGIDYDKAREMVQRKLADPLGLDVTDVAYGIARVANSAMTRVLRAVSTERGRDPREFTLLAFGGAGPIHAAALAESMEISRVVVPIYPGLFSALGLLLADYRHDYVASIAAPLDSLGADEIGARYGELRETALADLLAEGVSAGAVRIEEYVDLKYGYQMYEMTLPCPARTADLPSALAQLFTEAHQQAYGYHRDDPVELVSIRVRALASTDRIRFTDLAARLSARRSDRATSSDREAYFGSHHGRIATPVRTRFAIERREAGPIIIEEPDTTIVVPPGWSVERDGFANLILTRD